MCEKRVRPSRLNDGLGSKSAHTLEAPSFRLGRKAEIGVRSLGVRSWLQAVVRRIVHYVRLTSSSGHSAAPMHRHEKRRPSGVDRRLVTMAGGVAQTAAVANVSDRGYSVVKSGPNRDGWAVKGRMTWILPINGGDT